MHPKLAALLLALNVSTALATIHTKCYNYYFQKDGCVFAAADDRNRCNASAKPVHGGAVKFQMESQNMRRAISQTLVRRYDTQDPKNSYPVVKGAGICGKYDTSQDDGVCLWSGKKSARYDINEAGWLNYYIQRKGNPNQTWYAPVIDGCHFDLESPEKACSEIAFTNKTFEALGPSEEERLLGGVKNIIWDFDNLQGIHSQQGPV
ncbi:hypothetical protein O181_032374 [Austropuccinia psidii MF-1]|uniref:Secreted protein n=1 Tax=Austropuccinia psidii MF-1 TaxID=1389203 RepID=A0A9Q3CWP0_9BASI|nr:hypothetical protein [Austropuccinia psidii MF-1]